jgi:hypothetical protein
MQPHLRDTYIPQRFIVKNADATRRETSLFTDLHIDLEDVIRKHHLTSYLATIILPIHDMDPWTTILKYQDLIMSNVHEIATDIFMLTSSIEHHSSVVGLKELQKITSVDVWNTMAHAIATDPYYDQLVMREEYFEKIINFWECLKYLNNDNIEFRDFIDKKLAHYYSTKTLLNDDALYTKPITKKTNQNALKYQIITRYNVPMSIEASKCSCYGLNDCEYCKSLTIVQKCQMCSKPFLAEYESLCLDCYVSKALVKPKQEYLLKQEISSRIEAWICSKHNPKSLGRPHLHLAIIKAQELDARRTNKLITKHLNDLIKNTCYISVRNNNRATNPCINAIGYTWKNIENLYTFNRINRFVFNKSSQYRDEPIPLARTFFTKKGQEMFDVMTKLVQKYRNEGTFEHNPCTTLETEFTEEDDDAIQESTNYKSVEFGVQLRAIELIASHMRSEGYAINYDGTIWQKVKGTKMTYMKETMTLELFYNRVLLHFQENIKLFEHQKDIIKCTLLDSGCNHLLHSPIPRIKMSYRMVELADGFFDIVNLCFYRNQIEHPCWQYWNGIRVDTVYETIERKFLNDKSLWWKTCNSCQLWYVEYLADLYDQLLPKIMYRYILSHVGDNTDGLIFLLTPLLNFFPKDMFCEIRNTLNSATNKRVEKMYGPVLFPYSSNKALQQHIDFVPTWKSNGMHNSKERIATQEMACVREHSYVKDIIFDDRCSDTVIEEIPYIIIYTSLCSNAQLHNIANYVNYQYLKLCLNITNINLIKL